MPRNDDTANPLKDQNQNKTTTREKADQAQTGDLSTPTRETVTGQGGSPKGQRKGPDVDHPSQQGGVTPGRDATASERYPRPGTKTRGPSPADLPSSERTGTAPDRSGGPTRPGRDTRKG
ncbi:MAG TPA: hypothetical protein VD971_07160 [Phycisphaerales bacterium]|nr:hypothetical protein [Phycisphaerales bacterium]